MEDFVTELAEDPAYKWMGAERVSLEYNKALAWCRVNNRKATKRFFVNWLNKIEKPLQQEQKPRYVSRSRPTRIPTDAEFQRVGAIARAALEEFRRKMMNHEATETVSEQKS